MRRMCLFVFYIQTDLGWIFDTAEHSTFNASQAYPNFVSMPKDATFYKYTFKTAEVCLGIFQERLELLS